MSFYAIVRSADDRMECQALFSAKTFSLKNNKMKFIMPSAAI